MSSLIAVTKLPSAAQQLSRRSTSVSTADLLIRSLAIRRRIVQEDPSTFNPNYTIDSIKPPSYWTTPEPDAPEPMAYIRKPVTSACTIDLTSRPPKLSAPNTVSLTAEGTVRHGRYGVLSREIVENIPLEYLTLLHPSAQAAAALRTLGTATGTPEKGTVLVYGASQPPGMAMTQLASASGLAVIAVVDGQHSGEAEMVDSIKHMSSYPGTAIPEEYAVIKKSFQELVEATVHGETLQNYDCTKDFLPDFYQNVVDYATMFPEERGAAVDPSTLVFRGKEKDRAYYKDNMQAYLEQFPRGAPAMTEAELKEKINAEAYAVYKARFGVQTSNVISGDDTEDFEPARLVKTLMYSPEVVQKELVKSSVASGSGEGEYVPYEFNVLCPTVDTSTTGAGPIVGAVIVATPVLVKACEAVAKGKTLREKAEALQFLSKTERNAFAAASAVMGVAKKAGKEVVVVGGEYRNRKK